MTNPLPAEIDAVLAAQDVNKQRYGVVRQSMWFLYEHGGGQVALGSIEGPAAIPVVGQTVSVWDQKIPLVVEDVTTHYGLGMEGEQLVSVEVHVRPKRA